MNFLRFFLGTPARLLWTLGVAAGIFLLLLLVHLIWPGAIANAICGTIQELVPLFQAVIVLGIMLFGFGLMFRGLRGGRH